jgi:2OG-Fe(II) oxygenase superfamily
MNRLRFSFFNGDMAKKNQTKPRSSRVQPQANGTQTTVPVAFPSIPLTGVPLTSVSILDGQILVVPNFFVAETCKAFVECFSNLQLHASPPAKRDEAIRTNYRLATLNPDFANRLFAETGLQELTRDWTIKLGKRELGCKGLHSNIRIYRYDSGTFFGPHYDSCQRDAVNGFTSYWTLLVYLTGVEDGLEGGETVFYQGTKDVKEIVIEIERGQALLHRHGMSDCLLHEGRTVVKGTKWVLRSDLVFG